MLDFDEILVSIKNPQIKKYLEESIKSYQVGNYRSAILAVWIAAMFDLVKKFEILVDQREPTAIEKWNNLKPKIEDHKNWENELIDSAKAIAMISRYEADSLRVLMKTRNRYAHPSFDDVGTLFDPTPEEVRYFIRTLYDIVLSQPAQLGAFYVSQLLETIKSPNFFPTEPLADELILVKNLVIEKVSRINQKQIPRLIKGLFQALNSPSSKEHELNILCFVINLWGVQAELQCSTELSGHWDDYIATKSLNNTTLDAILSYPEFINKLSQKSQYAIESAFTTQLLKGKRYSESAIKFLASADIVPLAQSLLADAPHLIPIKKVIRQSSHYAQLLGNKYTEIFGESILKETRKVLKTRDGYQVNPVLSALRRCGIWNIANTLSPLDKVKFANELIVSLNSSNYETEDLLDFKNREDIPIQWGRLLLEEWLNNLRSDPQTQNTLPYYWKHYFGLVEHYTKELGNTPGQKEALKIIVSLMNENSEISDQIKNLASNELLSMDSMLN
ncbi:hypothetical protein [Nostoc sp. NMS4]|uniref:hypothetical protein n=1 Tax=Nostoc sp. NMS4 TaxID=2815390 RepID=UPI0025D1BDAF|nr:hypothetical protein [Nostoc sp. NMS4]MBN3923830.1 hypothetical protein [Nostoc sp. NMS4]